MIHRWTADEHQPNPDVYRNFSCQKCGAGPVRIEVMTSKKGITQKAKRQGIEPDCKDQQVKSVMES